MPTRLDALNNAQGAVTVFFDELKAEDIIEAQMKEVYADPRQYLYLKTVPESGKEFVRSLKDKRQAGDLAVPRGERMVFCHYLELRDLTEEWIDAFFERAYDFRKSMSTITTTFDQHYIFCFRYEVNTLEEDLKERAENLLKRLATGNEMISRQIYLLRIQGLNTYDNQEKGLVQMLHLISRTSYAVTLRGINAYKTYINMINYADYFENRVKSRQEQIKKIDAWMTETSDPDLNRMKEGLRVALVAPTETLGKEIRGFSRRIPLYPANIRDFKKKGFWIFTSFESTITKNNPIVAKMRKKFIAEKSDVLAEAADIREPVRICEQEYNYKDYELLAETLSRTDFSKNILDNTAFQDDAQKELAVKIIGRFVDRIQKLAASRDEIKEAKLRERKQCLRELDKYDDYANLAECFEAIYQATEPKPIAGMYPVSTNTITLVNDRCYNDWNSKGYSVQDVDTAFYYKNLGPCEIVMIKEYAMVNLADESADERLRILFRD